jgi:3-oxoacyl-[acyl-carrier protein] reductase
VDLLLEGHTAAVAAASSGLGYAAAEALIAEGVRVAICGSDPGRISAAAERLGRETVALTADLTRRGGGRRFVEDATEALGRLDILVTNTPGPPPGTFATTELAGYRTGLETTLLPAVEMCQAAVPPMRQRGWGRVVAITSTTVRQPIGNLIISTTARTGLTGFLKTLATEVAGDGVTVNSVQPGLHRTARVDHVYGGDLEAQLDGIPSGTVGDPRDFGAVVAFLCSARAGYVTGTAIPVDGGLYAGLQ